MTTCLRSLKFNLHPKLALIKARRSASHDGLPRVAHSNFLNEFLDNLPVWHAERTTTFRCRSKDLSTNTTRGVGVLPYDPALHVIIRPLVGTPDDIMLLNDTSSLWRTQVLEDDMQRNIILRENYPVTVLTGLKPIPAHATTVLAANSTSNAVPENNAAFASSQSEKDPKAKPTQDDLDNAHKILSETLPKFFEQPMDYNIFHKNIVFENNIRGLTTYGLNSYIQQMAMLRVVGHFKFAYVKMELLKVTKHMEDGTVRIRWRIRGLSALKVMLQFWRIKIWKFKTVKNQEINWYDGFSTFYVCGDGLIHRHVCDKMMPDDDKVKAVNKATTPMAAKLALLVGVLPRPPMESLEGICSFSGAEAKLDTAK